MICASPKLTGEFTSLEKPSDDSIIATVSGSLIRLKRIYNFLCSMLVFTPLA
jgi:hypothetical protein